jgi:hypothetical protein
VPQVARVVLQLLHTAVSLAIGVRLCGESATTTAPLVTNRISIEPNFLARRFLRSLVSSNCHAGVGGM